MIFDFKVEEQAVQPVLSIRTRTTMENLPSIIADSYTKIIGYLTELGEQPAYAPYTAYYNLDMQNLDVEMGFPVVKLFPDKDEIKAGQIPQNQIVSCMYKGAYSEMEEPYNKIMQWTNEHGYEPTGIFYEFYFNSPAEVPESELLTKIVIPLK